jgi:hypothetical protein
MPCESSASEFLRSTITVCQDCEGDSRKKLERASSNKHCYNTLDDEQPLPRPVAQSPLQTAYSVRYHSRESPSSSVGTVEDCHAGSKLMRCIPHAEDEVRAGVQTCFANTQSQSHGDESAETPDLAHQSCHSAPSDDNDRKPVLRAHSPQDRIRHRFHEAIAEEENHEAKVELSRSHIGIGGKAEDFRIAGVIPVERAQEVQQR